ncbi:MAG: hypothetical protein LUH63_11880 [Parabacteroides sp.]|nr:hypothetical protein [Parabacteroides sp.]
MSIKVGWYKTPVPGDREDTGLPHARVIPQGTIDMEHMCKMISTSSSFSSADVKGILEALNFWMGLYLSEGKTVELDGLGHFPPTLRSHTVTGENGKKKAVAQPDSVAFRCAPSLKIQIREAEIEELKRKKKEILGEDKRKENILDYVNKNMSINSSACMRISLCNRYTALKDLQELVDARKLIVTGNGKLTIYIRPY